MNLLACINAKINNVPGVKAYIWSGNLSGTADLLTNSIRAVSIHIGFDGYGTKNGTLYHQLIRP